MKPDKCKHFNGLRNDACNADVRYDTVKVHHTEEQQKLTLRTFSVPCLDSTNPCGATCEKKQLPTAVELAAWEAMIAKDMEDTAKVRAAIVAYLGGPWKRGDQGRAGSIPCPACGKGCVNFSRAGSNGHIHAKCSTPLCVSWME